MDKDPFSQRIFKTDPFPYILKYSPDILDIINTFKTCLKKKYRIKSLEDVDKDPFS